MGRIFKSYVRDEKNKFCCLKCGSDVAEASSVIWEGFMGSQKPAVLLRQVVNVEPYSAKRVERLSTGEYQLVDVNCRICQTPLGWEYVSATSPEQKYKEGASLLSEGRLQRFRNGTSLKKETDGQQ
mmetsp:Transcript_22309/g.49055  ORF Transcript_22309/g.49055 Transcript_22309/m.49055 type:complete len:126 (+) Transcript_22309:305-682(+)|eukprot:CAMPEP_0118926316 /NCGR_PEP_ID=MMETSP1169-20130426/4036_1 /TAXON_ID=36882 /ORGANISM="Pyramimonas obovata, Strain CCMP722" /LENGTH=125 /DNA_ID=CAMNT_0006867843 /DNA_START=305 /DNA_END=685 /DNA_ORIENTATION=-